MLENEIFDLHEKSPVLALLRQQTLPFTIACLTRAFGDLSNDDITEPQLTAAIRDVQDNLFEARNNTRFDKKPEQYIQDWIKLTGNGTDINDRPWLATRTGSGGQRLFSLLPSASQAIGIFDGLEIGQEFITNSALNTLIDRVIQDASRLSGNAEHRKAVLKNQIQEAQKELDEIERKGVKELDEFERNEISQNVLDLMNRIAAGFRAIPSQIRKHNTENQELYLTTEGSKEAILTMVSDRNKEKRQSPEYRVVTTLHGFKLNKELRGQYETAQEIIEQECRSCFTQGQVSRMRRFLTDLTQVGSDVYKEDAKTTRLQLQFIKSPSFREMRAESVALRKAQARISSIRDNLEPSPNDRRLEGVGLRLAEVPSFRLMSDLRLADTLPVEREVREATEVVSFEDAEEIRRITQEIARRGDYLKDASVKKRIMDAMGGRTQMLLSEVIMTIPLRYGAEEVSRYLTVAATQVPSRYDNGCTGRATYMEDDKLKSITFPDPLFQKEGPVGKNLAAYLDNLGGAIATIQPEAA